MNKLFDYFTGLFDYSDWPDRWHCGKWTALHGWLYILGDLLVWSAYFAIPLVILRFIIKRKTLRFFNLYLLFAIFILACGFTHLLSAVAFWYPLYRLNALMLLLTGIISWITVFMLIRLLPTIFSFRSKHDLEFEIEQRKLAEEKLRILNKSLDAMIAESNSEVKDYKNALDQSSIVAITDDRGIISYVNNNFCSISGFAKDALEGSDLVQRLKVPNSTEYIDQILEHILHGDTWRGDLKQQDVGGSIYYTATTIVPFINKEGNAYKYLFIFSDISEKMLAQRTAMEKTRQLEDILERITDGFIALDADFCYTYVNSRICEMVGRSPETLIGKNVWSEFPDAVESATFRSFQKAVEEQKYTCSIDYYEPLDLWQENHIYPSKDGLLVFIRDITKQKRAEFKIKQSENRFRKLIEYNEGIIALIDANSKPIYRSPSAERVTGITYEERKTTDSLLDIHPEDRQMMGELFKIVLEVPHVTVPVSFRTLHKNGHYIWLDGTFTNMLEEESIQAIVVNLRDITKKKLAEEKLFTSEKIYKTISSSIPGSVICLFDLDLTYLLIEGDMLEKFGYSKEMLLGNRFIDAVPLEVYEQNIPFFHKTMQGEVMQREVTRNGINMLTRYVPIKDEGDKVYMVMTVGIDITALKTAQTEVAALNQDLERRISDRTKQLQEANQELESFSYSVSHDLRAPLRSINGYSKMLEEDYSSLLDADGLRVLRTIQNNARRMGMLIDDLLSFSRLGRLEVKKALVNMELLVQSLLYDLKEGENVTAQIHIGQLHPAYADISLIKQVMINFISNAIKYSSKKKDAKVWIDSVLKDAEIVYAVRDNGTGFNMDYIHKLFNVFQRLHSTTEFEGTGVGLAIVKRIVEKHGGKVWAEGKVGEGATFYFSLPVPKE